MADFKRPPQAESSSGNFAFFPEMTFDPSLFIQEQTGVLVSNQVIMGVAFVLALLVMVLSFRPRRWRAKDIKEYKPDHRS